MILYMALLQKLLKIVTIVSVVKVNDEFHLQASVATFPFVTPRTSIMGKNFSDKKDDC